MRSFFVVLGVLSLPPFVAAADRENARALAIIASADDLGIKSADTRPLRLVKPFAVAVDAAGRLFVADPGNQGVVVYDKQGQQAKRWTGNAEVPLLGPAALAFDNAGRLFVADVYKSQVVVFDSDGKAVSALGKGLLRRPLGIAVDSARGRLFVADMSLRQVIPFDLQTLSPGKAIASPEPGKAVTAASVAVNSSGHVYVSDLRSCRVQVFNPDGTFQREFKTDCARSDEASRPMTVGRDDLVYVADPTRNTVEIFDAAGAALSTAESGKPSTPAFTTSGIAVGEDGRVYLTEHRLDEGRVQILQIARSRRKK